MDAPLDATSQADLVRSWEVSERELVEASIERIEALNGELNAVIHPLFEEALETEPADGPFRGVPFVVKDLICSVAGAPHHEGMRFLKELGFRADADSWLVADFPEATTSPSAPGRPTVWVRQGRAPSPRTALRAATG